METRETALFVYRKLVYLLYLEIGSLRPRIHAELAKKAHLKTAFFEREKERQALFLYQGIEQETDPSKIDAPFVERTGLTMEDVHRAFVEGDWRNKFGSFTTGGPRWAKVSEVALQLRAAIMAEDWDKVAGLLQEIKSLKTNQGYLIHQLDRADRRRG